MKSRPIPLQSDRPPIIIRVSGKLFQGHLPYLDQLVQWAEECRLLPVLKLEGLEELDRPALLYLIEGESANFRIESCPVFVRDWMGNERRNASAA